MAPRIAHPAAMGQRPGTGCSFAATVCAPHARPGNGRAPGRIANAVAVLLLLDLVAGTALASTPATFDTAPEDLPAFTEEMAARDPLTAEARCRSFVTALYHRLRTHGANPAWDPSEGQAEALDWVMEAYFTLPPASAGVRAARAASGDMIRAYLDSFGPAALASALPDDPLYKNDKQVSDGVLGLSAD